MIDYDQRTEELVCTACGARKKLGKRFPQAWEDTHIECGYQLTISGFVPTSSPEPARDETLACAGPWCSKKVTQPATGRPRLYCSDLCRKAKYRHERQLAEREAQRVAAEARAEEERHERARLAGQLVNRMRTDPNKAAMAIIDWMERQPDREHELWSLNRFLDRL